MSLSNFTKEIDHEKCEGVLTSRLRARVIGNINSKTLFKTFLFIHTRSFLDLSAPFILSKVFPLS